MGDNLPLIRLGAGNARLRADRVWHEVEAALLHTAAQRWQISWAAVRRYYNGASDALATLGVNAALRRFRDSDLTDVVRLWVDAAAFDQRHWSIPTQLLLHPRLCVLRSTQALVQL